MFRKLMDNGIFEGAALFGFEIGLLGALTLWSGGCDSKVALKAEGTATVKHVVTIEFGVCDTLEEPAAKVECVKSLLDILQEATAKPSNISGGE